MRLFSGVLVLTLGGQVFGNTITELIHGGLVGPKDIAVDADGNVYVTGITSNNAFRIAPGGVITDIIGVGGDGTGNTLEAAKGVAVDLVGNVYVAGNTSDNVFKITPDGIITEIIDATGDGSGKTLYEPEGIALDAGGNVYATGLASNNSFKITLDQINQPIPAVSERGLLVMSLLALMAGAMVLRRRRSMGIK